MGIDATRKWPEEGFTRNWPKLIEMDLGDAQQIPEQQGGLVGVAVWPLPRRPVDCEAGERFEIGQIATIGRQTRGEEGLDKIWQDASILLSSSWHSQLTSATLKSSIN